MSDETLIGIQLQERRFEPNKEILGAEQFTALTDALTQLGVTGPTLEQFFAKNNLSTEQVTQFLTRLEQAYQYDGRRIGEVVTVSGQREHTFYMGPETTLDYNKRLQPRKVEVYKPGDREIGIACKGIFFSVGDYHDPTVLTTEINLDPDQITCEKNCAVLYDGNGTIIARVPLVGISMDTFESLAVTEFKIRNQLLILGNNLQLLKSTRVYTARSKDDLSLLEQNLRAKTGLTRIPRRYVMRESYRLQNEEKLQAQAELIANMELLKTEQQLVLEQLTITPDDIKLSEATGRERMAKLLVNYFTGLLVTGRKIHPTAL